MPNELTLYDCLAVMTEFEVKAAENDGEISPEDMQVLTVAQTTSMEKLRGLVGYIKHLEAFDGECKRETKRIAERQRRAANRLESIKRCLIPFVAAKKHGLDVGTIHLGIGHSKAVETDPDFDNPQYMRIVPETKEPDKKKIAADLKANPDLVIKGATLVTREHLTIR